MDPTLIRNLYPRDSRLLRAIRDVLKRYEITENPKNRDPGWREFRITGGQEPYRVRISGNWEAPPQCTCPDHFRRAAESNQGFCKHIIAVLMSRKELVCQLLDIFL